MGLILKIGTVLYRHTKLAFLLCAWIKIKQTKTNKQKNKNKKKRELSKPLVKVLHWLPIVDRIWYKLS